MGKTRLDIIIRFLTFSVRVESAKYRKKGVMPFTVEDQAVLEEIDHFLNKVETVYAHGSQAYAPYVQVVRENVEYLLTAGEKEKQLVINPTTLQVLIVIKEGLVQLETFVFKTAIHSPNVAEDTFSSPIY